MDTDFEIFKGKSFKDLCRDIYSNQENRKEQIELLISELRPLVKSVNDAMIVVPLIKEYIVAGTTSDEHLVRLAAIIQKILTAQAQAEADGVGPGLISEEEKKQLFEEVKAVAEADKLLGVDILKINAK